MGKWTTTCKGFYDHRARKITITRDLFALQDSVMNFAKEKEFDEEKVIIYANYGYEALSGYVNNKGNEEVTLGGVIYAWASVIQERMKKEFPDLEFESIATEKDSASFVYYVPEISFKKWF